MTIYGLDEKETYCSNEKHKIKRIFMLFETHVQWNEGKRHWKDSIDA